MRCSVTFETPKELLDTLKYMIDEIENNKSESFSKILRIKNGFRNILKWNPNNLDDYGYVDLKINVIFNNPNKTEAQIVEIQFLLDFLLKAKKLGHKYYGIKRKDVQVHSVSNILYNSYNNHEKYKRKILEIIHDTNLTQLSMHLFLRPNCVFSIINNVSFEYPEFAPCLYKILYNCNSEKMSLLYLDCLFHFGEILLNEKKPLNYNVGRYSNSNSNSDNGDNDDHDENTIKVYDKVYIQKYLNFSLGDAPCINDTDFVK